MNYWIFQYTTNIYKDVIKDFKNETINMWEVTKHKKKIKKGDRAIIYIGGSKGKSVYGLAELTSEIYHIPEKERDYIDIKIIENWSESPVPYHLAKKEIPDLLIGISGTNFKASEEQFYKLKGLLL